MPDRLRLAQLARETTSLRAANDQLRRALEATADANAHAAELMAELEEARAALELARDDAVKANEAKSMFLANMSH
ncbi:MAG: hypothetical protein KC731_18310, partial [Myxococcales bacterium]|nr:hypothetical protein [Myxococcales bacterium]